MSIARPATANLLKNGDFSSATGWKFSINAEGTAKGTISYAAGQADINVTAASEMHWHLQLQQEGISLQPGTTYLLSFDAWADAPRSVNVALVTSDWKYQGGGDVSVTATKAPYQIEISASSTLAAGTLGAIQFNIGDLVSTVHFDNVSLVVKDGAMPIAPRPSLHPAPRVRLAKSRDGLSWSTRSPLTASAEMVVMDLQGREVGRFGLAAGTARGVINARLPQGLLMVRMGGMGEALLFAE
ncbi:MAG TPA: carbohydrate binding domain-containing protein [Fibrobacteria bacterium]|nr:carbohydrate binding domain-containing protein [Fibrobacteria bacterium]